MSSNLFSYGTSKHQLNRLRRLTATLLACALAAATSHAQTAWKAAPATNDWSTATNWTPATVPNLTTTTAVFGASTRLDPTVGALDIIDVAGFTFNAAAPAYTLTNNGLTSIWGTGVFNNSAVAQTLSNATASSLLSFFGTSTTANVTIDNFGTVAGLGGLTFSNSSTAGTATIDNTGASSIANFYDSSSAGGAFITNVGNGSSTIFASSANAANAIIFNTGANSSTEFLGNSGAGASIITNDNVPVFTNIIFRDNSTAQTAALSNLSAGGTIQFFDSATAANAFIANAGPNAGFGGSLVEFNNNSTAGSALIENQQNGTLVWFNNGSSAGTATISNLAGAGTSLIEFFNTSSAANATINNASPTGIVDFNDTATAGNAIINNSGSGLIVGAAVSFFGTSTAGGATINNSGGNANVLFSVNSTAGNATIINSGAGSVTAFVGSATGGQAALVNANATAAIDISQLTTTGMTAGSIAGNGAIRLGSKNLAVGGNNASTAFSGVIQDGGTGGGVGGSLTKAGSGMLTLAGVNTFTGGVTINAGALAVGSSQALGLGSVTINGGTLQTANGPRVINVTGAYTQTGGALQLGLAGSKSGQFDNVSVGGASNLGGTLQLKSVGGFMPSGQSSYTLLSSTGPVSGTFQNFDNPFAGTVLLYELVYNPNSVVLEITQGSFTPFALTTNQTNVARALNNVVSDPRASSMIQYLNMQPVGSLPGAFDAIAPEELSAAYQVVIANSDQYRMNLEQQFQNIRMGTAGTPVMAVAASTEQTAKPAFRYQGTGGKNVVDKETVTPVPEHRWGVFGTGFGDWADIDGNGNANGYTWTTGGFVAGANYRLGPNMAVGVAAGYSYTKTDFNSQGHLNVDDVTAGLYATYFEGPLQVNLFVGGGYESYDSERSGLQGNPEGDTEGGKFDTFLSTGYDLKAGKFTFTPTASVQYTYVGFNGFTESGSLAPLNIHSDSWNSLRSTLGARMNYLLDFKGIAFVPELRLAWLHEYLDNQTSVTADFANGAGSPFSVFAPTIGRDSMLFGASLSMQFTMAASAFLSYDAQFFRSNYSNQTFSGGLRFKF